MTCIVTLGIDAHAHAVLDALRRRHFPPERNFLAAHVTLFHALPSEHETVVRETLAEFARATEPFALRFAGARFLGRGVAIDVQAEPLAGLRRALATRFAPWLTAQDSQPFRPHVTVQNKVEPASARRLHAELTATWSGLDGRAESLLLWRYLGGPWAPLGEFRLGAER